MKSSFGWSSNELFKWTRKAEIIFLSMETGHSENL